MSEPFLHLGDTRLVRQVVPRRSRPHGLHAQAGYLDIDTPLLAELHDDIAVDGTQRSKSLPQRVTFSSPV
jgi:hypothetical protein